MENIQLFTSEFYTAIGVGAAIIVLRTLTAAMVRDFSKKLAMQFWFVRLGSSILFFLRDPVISGDWEVCWHVRSKAYPLENRAITTVYKLFSNVVSVGEFEQAGTQVKYLFVGRLDKGEKTLTGTWSDKSGFTAGYHGAYQVRFESVGGKARGKWLGFSDSKPIVRTGELTMEKLTN